MRFLKEIFNFVIDNKFEKVDKKKYINEMNTFNYNGIVVFSAGSLLISFIMFIISCFVKPMQIGMYTCAIFTMICFLTLILAKFIGDKDSKKIKILYYSFTFSMFMFYEIIGVKYTNDSIAGAICGVYVLIPLFNINNPRKYSVGIILLTIYLIIDTFLTKNINYAIIDCVDCSLFCITSCLLCYYMSNNQISIITNRNKIKEERDTDYLTKLNNRLVVEKNVNKSLINNDNTGVMLLIDLDNFKDVNDTYGHAAGDEILIKFANLLKKNFRKEDLIARIGGDEFIVFIEDLPNNEWITEKAQKLISDVNSKLTISDNIIIGCSIGVAYTKNNSKDYFELYQEADKAMYDAKNKGKNNYCIYKG